MRPNADPGGNESCSALSQRPGVFLQPLRGEGVKIRPATAHPAGKGILDAMSPVLCIALALAIGCGGERPAEADAPPSRSPPVRTVADLVIRPETRVVQGGAEGDSLRIALTLSHTGLHYLALELNPCDFEVYLYRTPERTPPAVWIGPRTEHCMQASQINLAPWDQITPWAWVFSKPIQQILGDSLREGRYYASASVAFRYWTRERPIDHARGGIWPDTLVWLPVGEATLRHGTRTRPSS